MISLFVLATLICLTAHDEQLLDKPILDLSRRAEYILEAEDVVDIRVVDLEEFSPQKLGPVRLDAQGNIHLPIVGRLKASGLTTEQLESAISAALSKIMFFPDVTVAIKEYRSRPVSVLGAVRNPGAYQLSSGKRLLEVLSLAGGFSNDSGNHLEITRSIRSGTLPLFGTTKDSTGQFSVGRVDNRSLMEASSPALNIEVLGGDVITVPKADLIYVIGAVRKPGGFPLNERESLSVLQALSLAEGLEREAGPKDARILREVVPGGERVESPVNLHSILNGKSKDIELQANDLLFVPTNKAKTFALRGLEAAIQVGTGVVIYRR